MRRLACSARCLIFLSSFIFLGTEGVATQQPSSGAGTAAVTGLQQGVYLVFPFENVGSSPRFDWLGEGLEELTIQRLAAAGEQVYSHAGRLAELERYGLPHSSKLSSPRFAARMFICNKAAWKVFPIRSSPVTSQLDACKRFGANYSTSRDELSKKAIA